MGIVETQSYHSTRHPWARARRDGMRRTWASLAAFCVQLGFLLVCGELDRDFEYDWRQPVIELSDANFHRVYSNHTHVLVMFYAPWCAHCKNLEPVYHQAGATLYNKGSHIVLAQAD